MGERIYSDRREAGRVLADELSEYAGRDNVVVYGLPRGGVPVAYEVAAKLGAVLDVFIVRKLGVPQQPELAMGAVAQGGTIVTNDDVVEYLRLSEELIQQTAEREFSEVRRREALYRGDLAAVDPTGRPAIVVDDGLATGASMEAAVRALWAHEPATIVVAVPVASPTTVERLSADADAVVCPLQPSRFMAVGRWYQDFTQTEDEEVRELLHRARGKRHEAAPGS